MKGRPVTDAERALHDKVAQLGCVACRQEGIYNPYISIHHVHGRTKAGCHMHVLPLCSPHHVDEGIALSVHPFKRRWEEKYGNQDDLVAAQWNELGVEHKAPERKAKLIIKKIAKAKSETESLDTPKPAFKPFKQTARQASKPAFKPVNRPESKSAPAPARIPTRAPTRVARAKIPASRVSASAGYFKPKLPKAKLPTVKFPKQPKPPKQPKTAEQVAFLEARRADQKIIMDERIPAIKAQAKAFADSIKAEYLETNKDKIAEQKKKQKEDQKIFRAEMKKKYQQAS